jgi:hypothetical protein
VPLLREVDPRFAVLRLAVLRDDFAAPPVEREPLLLAAEDRLEPEADDFARVEEDLRAPELLRAVDLRDVLLRAPLERDELLPAPLLREAPEEAEPELEPVLASPSKLHLPDMTRWAASATASAMIEPSLVALDMTFVAAAEAVSAASRPASRILRRAAGLALIAAAAAASPAASISLLIAALASLSIVSLDRDEEPEELFLVVDLAIASTPSVWRKDT